MAGCTLIDAETDFAFRNMHSKLVNSLRLKHAPVAILLTDDKPSEGIQFKPGRMGCVAAMLLTHPGAARASLTETRLAVRAEEPVSVLAIAHVQWY